MREETVNVLRKKLDEVENAIDSAETKALSLEHQANRQREHAEEMRRVKNDLVDLITDYGYEPYPDDYE